MLDRVAQLAISTWVQILKMSHVYGFAQCQWLAARMGSQSVFKSLTFANQSLCSRLQISRAEETNVFR